MYLIILRIIALNTSKSLPSLMQEMFESSKKIIQEPLNKLRGIFRIHHHQPADRFRLSLTFHTTDEKHILTKSLPDDIAELS